MKILFVGIFDVPWSTSFPLMREFDKKGHQVVPFDFRTIIKHYSKKNTQYFFRNKLGRLLRKTYIPFDTLNRYFLKINGHYQMNEDLLSEVRRGKYDLIFFAKAESVDWNNLSKINKFSNTWYWFMDSLKKAHKLNVKNYAKQCTWSSATFSNVCNYFKTYNKNSYFITEGIDTSLFEKNNKIRKEIDVVFIGSKDAKRKKYINYLRNNGINILWHGPGGDNAPIYLDEAILTYKNSKLVLNFTRDTQGFSDRVFQGLGAGTMVLTEYSYDIEKMFEKGKHLDWFTSKQDCLNKVIYYLENNAIREKIAITGTEYVNLNFTWSKTVDKILEIIMLKI